MNLAVDLMKKKQLSHTQDSRHSSGCAHSSNQKSKTTFSCMHVKILPQYMYMYFSRLTIVCTVLEGRFPGDVYLQRAPVKKK